MVLLCRSAERFAVQLRGLCAGVAKYRSVRANYSDWRAKGPDGGKIDFRILDEADHGEVWDMAVKFYAPTDPFLKISDLSTKDVEGYFGDYIQKSLQHHVSIGGFETQSRKLIAINLNLLGKLENYKSTEEVSVHSLPLHRKQQNAIIEYFTGRDLSVTFNTRDYMRTHLIFCHPEFSRRGIAKEMLRRTINIAKDEDCQKIIALPSAPYAEKITSDLGFIREKSVKFKDYVDPYTKKKILEEMPERDTAISLYVKYLS